MPRAGISSTSNFLPSQKILASRSSSFCLLAKHTPDFLVPTHMKQFMCSLCTNLKTAKAVFKICAQGGTRLQNYLLPLVVRDSSVVSILVPASHAGGLLSTDTINIKYSPDYRWVFYIHVPRAGLEPARCNQPRILSPLCLPFHHPGKLLTKDIGRRFFDSLRMYYAS